ncbi:MAG: hypothetical protein AAFV80_23155 [Bacteroidota bacterium]
MKVLFSICLILLVNVLHGAIDPIYKDCTQRGYMVVGDSCLFPDGRLCALLDFNEQRCGQEFYDVEFCVEAGGYVWDSEACCAGLRPWLPARMVGQTVCRSQSYILKAQFRATWEWWIGGTLLLITLFYTRLRKQR